MAALVAHPSDVGDGRLPLDCPGGASLNKTQGLRAAQKRWSSTFGWLDGLSVISRR